MILVTGATGLLGSEIIKMSPGTIGISTSDCDLSKSADIINKISENKNIKTVIHCAAKVGGVKSNTENVADFFDKNIKINTNVMNVCKEKKLKLISILSTCVYPDSDFVKYPLTEDQLHMGPPHPSNFGYAYAKRMLDVQSRAYRQQYGCNFITVIPNNLYGANDNYNLESGHVVPALIKKFYEAKKSGNDSVTVWGTGSALREFTFARDAAKIILWLARNYDEPGPVNIGNTEQVSIRELSKIISEIVGFNGKIIFDITKPEGQYKKPSSNKKLKQLGWNEKYTPLKNGLTETFQKFLLLNN